MTAENSVEVGGLAMALVPGGQAGAASSIAGTVGRALRAAGKAIRGTRVAPARAVPQVASEAAVAASRATQALDLAVPKSSVRWVDERAGMHTQARAYNDSAMGARSNTLTKSAQAPSLPYRATDGTTKMVRFDGLDGSVLIDRKISIVTTQKSANQALRQSEALLQHGLTARWEVPNAAQAARAQKMLDQLGIKNIEVQIVRLSNA